MWPSIGALLHYTWTSPQCEFTIFFRFLTVCLVWKHPFQDDCTAYITFGFQITWSFKTTAHLYKPWHTLTYLDTHRSRPPSHTETSSQDDWQFSCHRQYLVTHCWHLCHRQHQPYNDQTTFYNFFLSGSLWFDGQLWVGQNIQIRDCSINPSSLYQSGAHSGDIGDNFSKSMRRRDG